MLDNDKSSWDYSELVEIYNKNQFEEVIEKINTMEEIEDPEFDPLSGNNTKIYNLLAASYLGLNNYEQASNCYAKILSIDPNNYDALVNLGNIKLGEKSYQLAFDLFSKTSSNQNIDSQILAKMGMCLFKLDHFDDGIALCEEAISSDPKCEIAYFFLAEIMEEIEDPEAVVTYYYKVLEQNPNSYLAHLLLGNYFFRIEVNETAIKFYKKANIIDPSQNEPLFRISDIMSKMENYEEEIFYLKKIIDLNNQDPKAYNLIGVALQKLKNYEEANERFLDAIYLHPNYSEAYTNLGKNLIELGRLIDSYECLHKSLEINKDQEEAFIGLNRLFRIIDHFFKNKKTFSQKYNQLDIKTVKEFIDSLGLNHEDFSQDLLNEKIYRNFKNIISES